MAETIPRLKPRPRILTVSRVQRLSPNMIRVTFACSALEGIATDRAGGNCKLMIPQSGQSQEAFSAQFDRPIGPDNPKPTTRTYTVRQFRTDPLEMDIDFLAHGDEGPASAWAEAAAPGSFLGFAGPGAAKVLDFEGDWWLVAADLSALPVASVALEAMPRTAKGLAIFEVTDPADRQAINAPEGVEIRWLHHPDVHKPSAAQEQAVREINWPDGRIRTCIAGESGVIKALRGFLHNEKNVPRADTYISGYWKIGLVEDEHQAFKRAEG